MSTFHPVKTFILIFMSTFLLAACGEEASNPAPEQSLTDYLVEDTYNQFKNSPESVSSFGLSVEEVGMKTNHLLDDRSPAAEARARADFLASLEVVSSYNRDDLNADEQLYYDIFMATANDAKPMLDMAGPFSPSFPSYYRLSQLAGPHLNLPQLLQSAHPVESIEESNGHGCLYCACLLQGTDSRRTLKPN